MSSAKSMSLMSVVINDFYHDSVPHKMGKVEPGVVLTLLLRHVRHVTVFMTNVFVDLHKLIILDTDVLTEFSDKC